MFQGFFEIVLRARIEELSKDQTVPEYASFANKQTNKQTNKQNRVDNMRSKLEIVSGKTVR